MNRTKLVKVPRPLYERASALAEERCVTIGAALEILCMQKAQVTEPLKSLSSSKKDAHTPAKASRVLL